MVAVYICMISMKCKNLKMLNQIMRITQLNEDKPGEQDHMQNTPSMQHLRPQPLDAIIITPNEKTTKKDNPKC